MPYSVCGCVPDPVNSGHPVSHFVSTVSHKDSTFCTVDSPHEDADAPRTFGHYLGVGDPSGEDVKHTVITSEFKTERGYYHAEKAPLSPTHDPWVNLQSERNQKDTKRDIHKEAFIDPYVGAGRYYPYWGISMIPTFG